MLPIMRTAVAAARTGSGLARIGKAATVPADSPRRTRQGVVREAVVMQGADPAFLLLSDGEFAAAGGRSRGVFQRGRWF